MQLPPTNTTEPADLVRQVVGEVYGSRVDHDGISPPDAKSHASRDKKSKKLKHGQVLQQTQIQQSHLTLSVFKNRTGSFSYRVTGQLPLYVGPPRPDLVDRKKREILIPDKKPRFLRENFTERVKAASFLDRLSKAYLGFVVKRGPVDTFLTEEEVRRYEQIHLGYKPFLREDPNAPEEGFNLYKEQYGNLLKPISARELFKVMAELEAPYFSRDRLKAISSAVSNICRACGHETADFDGKGRKVYDIEVSELTTSVIQQYVDTLPFDRATEARSAISRFLRFAVEQRYLKENVADQVVVRQTRADKMAKAKAEVVTDDNAQVQIALNIAAIYKPGDRPAGYFVPNVVFLYYAAMRPISELREMSPSDVRLPNNLIRLWSTKKLKRRIKKLPANAVIMLERFWDGKPLSFKGWDQFWKLVQAAQGYDVPTPVWFNVPVTNKSPAKPDVPRHTGCSHGMNRAGTMEELLREDDHQRDTFKISYEGLKTKPDSAGFYSLFMASMEITNDDIERVIKDLIDNELLKEGEPLPQPPVVPTFNVVPPPRQLWLPPVPDDVLRDEIWRSGFKRVAAKYGITTTWLMAVCRAKRIPTPKCGRSRREDPAKAPLPPPVTTKSDEELKLLISALHRVRPASKQLDIKEVHLRAYCAVHQIPIPNAQTRALHFNNRARVRLSRRQVQHLLGTKSIEEVAEAAKVPVEELRAFCDRHAISAAPPPSETSSESLDAVRSAVMKDLQYRSRLSLKNDEAMELILSKAPNGLTQDELIQLVREIIGTELSPEAISYVVKQQSKGRFQRRHGRIRLVGAYSTPVDLEQLKTKIKADINGRGDWQLIDAVRCALPKTPGGLSLEQLREVLPLFGIGLDAVQLKRELRRLDQQCRISFYHNQVTIPAGGETWKIRVQDKDPTPGIDVIRQKAQELHRNLADQEFTNVRKMKFILSQAPEGLWRDEILDIAKACGIDLKESCIHSVVDNEAKGGFECKNGRVRLIGAFEPVTVTQVKSVLADIKCSDRDELVLEFLRHFAAGLHVNELCLAVKLAGHRVSRDTFRRRLYHLARRGLLVVNNARVTAVIPPVQPAA